MAMQPGHLEVLTPVAAIERGIDVEPSDVLIGTVAADPGELEPPAFGFPSIEHLQAFIAEHEPDLVTVEGGKGEDVSWLRGALGLDSASALH